MNCTITPAEFEELDKLQSSVCEVMGDLICFVEILAGKWRRDLAQRSVAWRASAEGQAAEMRVIALEGWNDDLHHADVLIGDQEHFDVNQLVPGVSGNTKVSRPLTEIETKTFYFSGGNIEMLARDIVGCLSPPGAEVFLEVVGRHVGIKLRTIEGNPALAHVQ